MRVWEFSGMDLEGMGEMGRGDKRIPQFLETRIEGQGSCTGMDAMPAVSQSLIAIP